MNCYTEITYNDPEGQEIRVVPIRVQKEPFVYFVPSTLTFERSVGHEGSIVDWYSHPNGGHLRVERYVAEIEGEGTLDGYTMIANRAEEIPTCEVRPARLQTGFSMISYEEPSSEGEELVRLCSELCIVRDDLLAVILFFSTIHLDDLNLPDVCFHAYLIRHFAKMTEWCKRRSKSAAGGAGWRGGRKVQHLHIKNGGCSPIWTNGPKYVDGSKSRGLARGKCCVRAGFTGRR